MATFRHPKTGVELNQITVRRTQLLTETERETARLLLDGGEPLHIVAAMFGINQGRISEAFPGHKTVKDADQGDLF